MNKVALVLVSLASVFCMSLASCPFSAGFDVSWDGYRWIVNKESQPSINVIAGEVNIFNISTGSSEFFITSHFNCSDIKSILGRKDNVTNNACTPPCTVAMKLVAGQYYYCSNSPNSVPGSISVLECDKLTRPFCGKVIGCGLADNSECKACSSADSKKSCEKISDCEWCDGDKICLHKNSGVCRARIERDRSVASWVWLLITLCGLLVLVAIFATLFITERNFKARWAAMSKADSDLLRLARVQTMASLLLTDLSLLCRMCKSAKAHVLFFFFFF